MKFIVDYGEITQNKPIFNFQELRDYIVAFTCPEKIKIKSLKRFVLKSLKHEKQSIFIQASTGSLSKS